MACRTDDATLLLNACLHLRGTEMILQGGVAVVGPGRQCPAAVTTCQE